MGRGKGTGRRRGAAKYSPCQPHEHPIPPSRSAPRRRSAGRLADFFGPSGAYAHCWCTWFRQSSKDFDEGCLDAGAGNKEVLRRLTDDGRVPGLLAYDSTSDGSTPVGWVSVAPREEFGRILRSPTLKPHAPDGAGVWSVVCFWVPRARRGQAFAHALLAGAVDWAVANGAQAVEGYPVDTTAGRKQAAAIFTGTVSLFARAGFTPVRAAKPAAPAPSCAAT